MAIEKTPGPEVFLMEVYKRCWAFMKADIMGIVSELQSNSFVNWRVNNAFLVLILKKEGEK